MKVSKQVHLIHSARNLVVLLHRCPETEQQNSLTTDITNRKFLNPSMFYGFYHNSYIGTFSCYRTDL